MTLDKLYEAIQTNLDATIDAGFLIASYSMKPKFERKPFFLDRNQAKHKILVDTLKRVKKENYRQTDEGVVIEVTQEKNDPIFFKGGFYLFCAPKF
ncbi:hypothetical protein [Vibrio alginolyticus]|uniref:hypothetical protein n=1 Tax=Vibrio TaxID=662 RepID=UPI0006CAA207|nr:hypothetical protein [Vibrio alginolyticus]KPM97448.1 hypothetical protein AOG25_13305 [Vibrio alginolyticus]CAH7183686.1 conserved hypothetical protein [Vibrio chagasii]CAH7352724.1 conserved hypothetical protein [Vibrio chagasii]